MQPEEFQYNERMSHFAHLSGVYAAAITPLKEDFSPSPDEMISLLDFLARRGCHGALLLGTTGEGPSFSPKERETILRTALEIRQVHPQFRLFAGTGTPSLEETIELTKAAFNLGMDGVVVLPPYYYRKVSDHGLFAWFSQVLERSVPAGGALLGYHIPAVSGVPLSPDLVDRLLDSYPGRFAGIKDSSADPEHATLLGERFGRDLLVLNGNDPLFSLALGNRASGAITALANVLSPYLRRVWEAHQRGEADPEAQSVLLSARTVLDHYPPAPYLLKALLAHRFEFPMYPVRPPLLPFPSDTLANALAEMDEAVPEMIGEQ